MTIAACHLSSEGVVFGADSTATMFVPGPVPAASVAPHQFDCAQKIFEIGQEGTLGITMWGLGGLGAVSYRTLVAQFADSLAAAPAATMREAADRWNQDFWSRYSAEFAPSLQRAQQLLGQPARSSAEESELAYYRQSLSGGFCIGGYLLRDRSAEAYEISFGPTLTTPGQVQALPVGATQFWGVPELVKRLTYGIDFALADAILRSGKWTGTVQDFAALMEPYRLVQPLGLPIREAIDLVYASIYTTIKAMKFSHLERVCGGPVEIAVITTDRPFRWVRHKGFDAAVVEGGHSHG